VYPAGFLYLFSGLRTLTGGGDVPSAQAAFAALYLATQAVVLALYVCAMVGFVARRCALCWPGFDQPILHGEGTLR